LECIDQCMGTHLATVKNCRIEAPLQPVGSPISQPPWLVCVIVPESYERRRGHPCSLHNWRGCDTRNLMAVGTACQTLSMHDSPCADHAVSFASLPSHSSQRSPPLPARWLWQHCPPPPITTTTIHMQKPHISLLCELLLPAFPLCRPLCVPLPPVALPLTLWQRSATAPWPWQQQQQ
jgi:hypothetical protein